MASPAGRLSRATFCHPRTCDSETHKGGAGNAQAGETSDEEESDEEHADEGERKRRKEDGNSQGTMNRIQTSGRRTNGPEGAKNMRGGRIHSV